MDGERTRTIFHLGAKGQRRERENGARKREERSNGPETTRTDWVTTREDEGVSEAEAMLQGVHQYHPRKQGVHRI